MTKETYLRSVDVLLDAYNSGTLFHGHCAHCAVGNLLDSSIWSAEFFTTSDGVQNIYTYIPKLSYLYEEAGFTREELMKIEFAFESSISHNYMHFKLREPKQGQYLGLCAVLKVMAEMVEEPVNPEKMSNLHLASVKKLNNIAQKFNVTI